MSQDAGNDDSDKGQEAKGGKRRRSNALPPPPPAVLAKALGVSGITIEWLAGDGSDRCYYRLSAHELKGSLVLMQLSGSDAQALANDGYDWIRIAALLYDRKIFVPRVIAALPEHAALVIEDYGDVMLEGIIFDLADKGAYAQVRDLYRQCSTIVARFLAIPPSPQAAWCKRSFDAERFTWELNFFMQKYAAPVAGLRLSQGESAQLTDDIQRLGQTLAATSRYFVHRDFHSRNVMVKGEKLAVIDFQDARLGPASYDLVSLCFDSYVPFTGPTRTELFRDGVDVIRAELGAGVAAEIEELWRPMLLQRQLKAIGSFGFLTIDKQRGDYLKYVGPALKTLEDQGVADDRWPFLSGPLLQRLRQHLDQQGHGSRS
jgi:aminoglycoside/choline kinase family phosphotransferase